MWIDNDGSCAVPKHNLFYLCYTFISLRITQVDGGIKKQGGIGETILKIKLKQLYIDILFIYMHGWGHRQRQEKKSKVN